jgi:hypothetical protein
MARPKLRSPDQPPVVRFLFGLYEALASLKLAVFVIAASAVVLGWATVVERDFGTEAVQFGVYQTWWFAALLALLGLNVLAACLIRFPWKRHQTGFVITHAGIIVLLIGCLLSRMGGIDAQMPIFEESTGHLAFEDTQHFALKVEPTATGTTQASEVNVPFAPGPFSWQDYSSDLIRLPGRASQPLFWFPWRLAHRDWGRIYDDQGIRLEVLDYYSDSRLMPAPPLVLKARSGGSDIAEKDKDGKPDTGWTTVSLNVRRIADPLSPNGRLGLGSREQLGKGPRIVFWVAQNKAETEAFLQSGPVGEPGKDGQLVFHVGTKRVPIPVEKFQQQTRQPLGDTGLEVELLRVDPQMLGIVLRIHAPDSRPREMILLADHPEFSRQDEEHGVYGEYWVDATKLPKDTKESSSSAQHPELPRIDILQGVDRKLYYRTWTSPRFGAAAPLPLGGTKITAFEKSVTPVTFFVTDFTPHDQPGVKLQPVPFAKKRTSEVKERRCRVRLTVDGNQKEFWLAGLPKDPSGLITEADQQYVVDGKDRRVTLTLPWDRIDTGFQLYLHKFQRKLDPGSSQASHYSSLVELRDRDGNKVPNIQGNTGDNLIRITLNQPVNFSDPTTGRSYRIYQEAFRGPWKPGDPEFDRLAGGSGTRDELFLSWLTINYDPGRGLKYTGCLMIVAGIATMFYMRAYFFRPRMPLEQNSMAESPDARTKQEFP